MFDTDFYFYFTTVHGCVTDPSVVTNTVIILDYFKI